MIGAATAETTKGRSLQWLLDFEAYSRLMLKIQDKSGRTIPLRLNGVQQRFRAEAGRRNVILKFRQVGISTLIEAEILHEAQFMPGRRAVIITHEAGATFVQKERVKFMYSHQVIKPGLDRDNRRELSFPSLNSSIYTGTAGGREFGRSDTIHRAHCSEYAFWTHPQVLAGLMEAVPDTGRIDIESTPNGHNHFYQLWKEAKAGISPFKPCFYPWYIHPDYQRMPGIPAQEWDTDEKTAADKALRWGVILTPEQIAWRRWKRAGLKAADSEGANKFSQEYPEDDETCFLFSGRPRFDAERLNGLLAQAREPLRTEKAKDSLLTLRVWAEPTQGESYVIGADSAEGVSAGDYSSAKVIEWRSGAKVASLYGKSDPFVFAVECVKLARRYNDAQLGIEKNHPGPAVLAKCIELGYPNIYWHVDEKGKRAERPGWSTDSYWRPQMVDELAQFVASAPAECLPDSSEIGEMLSFVVGSRGKAEAAMGAHDDQVMSASIALMIRKLWHPRERQEARPRRDTLGGQR